ncbi:TYRO protein tyrosine kinase-binding protein-like isoform X4 [Hippocampus zosterae]|uniref:TYRO protein tyrosine kinase-binding protein-like isoform X4 n=1 Tax=Hippocampus zosterae TaxID=109293 RepID=UPI00223D4E93|nr:TYRO protein tyrosine kinase-binding protein-like isoform X4 [Hippocampus zosterae]
MLHLLFVDGTHITAESPQRSAGTMACSKLFILLFCVLCNQAVAQKDSPVSCYTIEPGMLAGIISADVLLTLIIVTITYRCASNQSSKNHKHREKDDHKVYMNVRT